MDLLLYLVLVLVLVIGLYVNLAGAPGLWLMVLGTLLYAWATHGAYAGRRTIFAIILLAGAAEILEFLAAGAGAKRAGASRRGLWGAIIGGIVGAICFTALIPVPVIGTIFGVCLGTFLGAILGEVMGGTEIGHSLRIGLGAAKGRLMGIFTKLLFGCAILATVMWTALPPIRFWHHPAKPLKPPTSLPVADITNSEQLLAFAASPRTIGVGTFVNCIAPYKIASVS